jgi:hypothetical protein
LSKCFAVSVRKSTIASPPDRNSGIYHHVRGFLAKREISVHPQAALNEAIAKQGESVEALREEYAAGFQRIEEKLASG